jgi:hypothetical protein
MSCLVSAVLDSPEPRETLQRCDTRVGRCVMTEASCYKQELSRNLCLHTKVHSPETRTMQSDSTLRTSHDLPARPCRRPTALRSEDLKVVIHKISGALGHPNVVQRAGGSDLFSHTLTGRLEN